MRWYNVKITYKKNNDAGKWETVKEEYLVDAVSFTDCETRFTSKAEEMFADNQRWSIENINPVKVMDMFVFSDDYWYKAKVESTLYDEKSGKEKKQTLFMYVNAPDFDTALARLNENLKTWISPSEVQGLVITNIIDVFPYQGKLFAPKEPSETELATESR